MLPWNPVGWLDSVVRMRRQAGAARHVPEQTGLAPHGYFEGHSVPARAKMVRISGDVHQPALDWCRLPKRPTHRDRATRKRWAGRKGGGYGLEYAPPKAIPSLGQSGSPPFAATN